MPRNPKQDGNPKKLCNSCVIATNEEKRARNMPSHLAVKLAVEFYS